MIEVVRAWPTAADVDRFATKIKVGRDAVIRDIVRTVSIARLVHEGVLSDDWVLTGGMAMRLRGSTRFTMRDTDTSRRDGYPDRQALADALRIDDDELVVTPADSSDWKSGKQLVTAQPIEYEAFFADVGAGPVEDAFSFTVSWRGVLESADALELVHPYNPALVIERTVVPVMNLTEQTAEKIVGWAAHGLIKHYVDVAWIFHALGGGLDIGRLPALIEAKLNVGRRLFPTAYAKLTGLTAVVRALHDPDAHVPPLGDRDDGASQIRFAGAGLNKQQAIEVIRTAALPALIKAAHGSRPVR
ncbi:MAG TPA: nucleotidyl transferase AbiEii/AbiGii toxin family protein [Solirubrobacteraceae bacterium]|nr:nucleotidyl transferase AbiEii/AbiGii toxin family protein [Solirubrobacteraceae bacterium]